MHLGLKVDFQKGLSINLEPEDNGIIPSYLRQLTLSLIDTVADPLCQSTFLLENFKRAIQARSFSLLVGGMRRSSKASTTQSGGRVR